MQAANPIHKRIDQRIIQPPNHHSHGIPHQRMVEAGQLPRSQMPGQHQHALAPLPRCEIMLQSLVADEAAGLCRRIARHLAELRQQVSQVAIDRAQNGLALGSRLRRKRQFQIAQPNLAQTPQTMKGKPANGRTHGPRQSARKNPKQEDKSADHAEFGPLPCSGSILPRLLLCILAQASSLLAHRPLSLQKHGATQWPPRVIPTHRFIYCAAFEVTK